MEIQRDLTPEEVADWCRKQGNRWLEIASFIQGFSGSIPKQVHPPEQRSNQVQVDLFQIRERLKRSSARIGQLAEEFHVPESKIEELIGQDGSGVTEVERGWLKLTV